VYNAFALFEMLKHFTPRYPRKSAFIRGWRSLAKVSNIPLDWQTEKKKQVLLLSGLNSLFLVFIKSCYNFYCFTGRLWEEVYQTFLASGAKLAIKTPTSNVVKTI